MTTAGPFVEVRLVWVEDDEEGSRHHTRDICRKWDPEPVSRNQANLRLSLRMGSRLSRRIQTLILAGGIPILTPRQLQLKLVWFEPCGFESRSPVR